MKINRKDIMLDKEDGFFCASIFLDNGMACGYSEVSYEEAIADLQEELILLSTDENYFGDKNVASN